MGIPLHEVAEEFMDSVSKKEMMNMENDWSRNYNPDPNYLWYIELADLISHRFEVLSYSDLSIQNYDEFGTVISEGLSSGHYFINLVRLNTPDGRITASGNCDHWVTITGISSEWNRNESGRDNSSSSKWKWIRIYDPYDNTIEYYWWGDYRGAIRHDTFLDITMNR